LGRKWISWVNTHQTTLAEIDVKDRFVFIGTDAMGIMPQLATPVGLLEPHKIQAALAESILITNSPRIPDWSLAAELAIFSLTVAVVWSLLHFMGITWGIGLAGVSMASTGYLGVYLIQQGVLIDVTWALIGQAVAGSAAFYLRFREQYKLRQLIKKQFEHYLDPAQVKRLQKDPDLLKLGGEKRRCTFLFTDVRGFTALSEILPPEEVTLLMNKVLTIQADTVKYYGGMVDKYIGDAMMAIFNAPMDLQEHERVAVYCAKEIQDKIKKANLGVAIGVGVNTGEAVIGNMGSNTRFDYSAIGDAVNTAARLESATKEAGVDILIGEETERHCGIPLKSLKPMKVKGKEKPLKIYTF